MTMRSTRREFLKVSLGALSFGVGVPSFLRRATLAASSRAGTDNTLVVVQLTGGNDGLNTVVPFEDDAYARSRPTLRLPKDRLHRIDPLLGLHPQMEAFVRLYEQGHLSIVHGVGYPNSNRNHDEALRDWETARPGETGAQTGWLGRVADGAANPGAGAPAVFLGQIERPFGLNAEKTVVSSIRSVDDCRVHDPPGPEGGDLHRRLLARAAESPRPGTENPLLDFLRREAIEAQAGSDRIGALAEATASGGYPDFQLARTLASCARLIRADLGIRVYFVELGGGGIGGFDTHANQGANHGALLEQLSRSVAAFVEDLRKDGLLERVLLMTFSEFGRTLAENGRRGTDHGAGAPVFLAGGKLKGGLLGAHPRLDDLDGGAPKFHTDFRRLYATVLDRWIGIDSRAVLGGEFEPLDVLRS